MAEPHSKKTAVKVRALLVRSVVLLQTIISLCSPDFGTIRSTAAAASDAHRRTNRSADYSNKVVGLSSIAATDRDGTPTRRTLSMLLHLQHVMLALIDDKSATRERQPTRLASAAPSSLFLSLSLSLSHSLSTYLTYTT
uniref:Uncharacterized protein n=1 Tax=Hyaloperonospora arabidopsidis (strain Emoy2) TaxID=559515 RepID=M4BLI6_HYAAE